MYYPQNKLHFRERPDKRIISVIIAVKDDASGLERTIKSLQAAKQAEHKIQIVVGNDGDNPEVESIARKYGVDYVASKIVKGAYAMRNMASERAKGEILAFIDAETIAERNWLREGVLALKIIDYASGPIKLINPSKLPKYLEIYQQTVSFDVESYLAKLHFAPTTNLWTKRSVFEAIGGFDERLRSSGDYEWGVRAYTHNIREQYFEKLMVYHPIRNYQDLVLKQKRVAEGHVQLKALYPKQFSGVFTVLLVASISLIIPPLWVFEKKNFPNLSLSEKAQTLMMAWAMHLIYNALIIKYSIRYLLRRS